MLNTYRDKKPDENLLRQINATILNRPLPDNG
jgi:hypothetical protein